MRPRHQLQARGAPGRDRRLFVLSKSWLKLSSFLFYILHTTRCLYVLHTFLEPLSLDTPTASERLRSRSLGPLWSPTRSTHHLLSSSPSKHPTPTCTCSYTHRPSLASPPPRDHNIMRTSLMLGGLLALGRAVAQDASTLVGTWSSGSGSVLTGSVSCALQVDWGLLGRPRRAGTRAKARQTRPMLLAEKERARAEGSASASGRTRLECDLSGRVCKAVELMPAARTGLWRADTRQHLHLPEGVWAVTVLHFGRLLRGSTMYALSCVPPAF